MSLADDAFAKLSIQGNSHGEPLNDITGSHSNANSTAPDGSYEWMKPEKYDYKIFNASIREEREAAERGVAEREGGGVDTTQDTPVWATNAVKYEWNDEYGDIGPAHPELEKQLFRNEHITRQGDKIHNITGIKVTVESQTKIQCVSKFSEAGLHPIMLKNVELSGYDIPTPVQAYCLPAILKNHDVIAVAQTGSGKTAAFLIPTLSKLMGKAKKLAAARPNLTSVFNPQTDGVRAEPLILVVAPTRELATQIFDEARKLCYRSMLRPCVAYGGAPARDQADELRKGCDVLIATPGRLKDFLQRQGLLSLHRVKYTVIDEADEMVDVDWDEDMKIIMAGADNNDDADHIFMMFSATFPKEARQLARKYMSLDHIRIRVGRAGSTHANVKQTIVYTEEPKKRDCLYDLLVAAPPARTIIFVNNKKAADFLDDYLYNRGLPSTSIHSDRTQREREDALRAFKSGKAPILVATGVSARGLDVKNVMHVVNYDLPSSTHGGIQEYIHRIGRTARIGNEGLATSFYNERNEDLADALVKVLLESQQVVPDFLEAYKPEDVENLDFEDDTDNEGEYEMNDGGEAVVPGFGGAATEAPASAAWDTAVIEGSVAPASFVSAPLSAAPAAAAAPQAPAPFVADVVDNADEW